MEQPLNVKHASINTKTVAMTNANVENGAKNTARLEILFIGTSEHQNLMQG